MKLILHLSTANPWSFSDIRMNEARCASEYTQSLIICGNIYEWSSFCMWVQPIIDHWRKYLWMKLILRVSTANHWSFAEIFMNEAYFACEYSQSLIICGNIYEWSLFCMWVQPIIDHWRKYLWMKLILHVSIANHWSLAEIFMNEAHFACEYSQSFIICGNIYEWSSFCMWIQPIIDHLRKYLWMKLILHLSRANHCIFSEIWMNEARFACDYSQSLIICGNMNEWSSFCMWLQPIIDHLRKYLWMKLYLHVSTANHWSLAYIFMNEAHFACEYSQSLIIDGNIYEWSSFCMWVQPIIDHLRKYLWMKFILHVSTANHWSLAEIFMNEAHFAFEYSQLLIIGGNMNKWSSSLACDYSQSLIICGNIYEWSSFCMWVQPIIDHFRKYEWMKLVLHVSTANHWSFAEIFMNEALFACEYSQSLIIGGYISEWSLFCMWVQPIIDHWRKYLWMKLILHVSTANHWSLAEIFMNEAHFACEYSQSLIGGNIYEWSSFCMWVQPIIDRLRKYLWMKLILHVSTANHWSFAEIFMNEAYFACEYSQSLIIGKNIYEWSSFCMWVQPIIDHWRKYLWMKLILHVSTANHWSFAEILMNEARFACEYSQSLIICGNIYEWSSFCMWVEPIIVFFRKYEWMKLVLHVITASHWSFAEIWMNEARFACDYSQSLIICGNIYEWSSICMWVQPIIDHWRIYLWMKLILHVSTANHWSLAEIFMNEAHFACEYSQSLIICGNIYEWSLFCMWVQPIIDHWRKYLWMKLILHLSIANYWSLAEIFMNEALFACEYSQSLIIGGYIYEWSSFCMWV